MGRAGRAESVAADVIMTDLPDDRVADADGVVDGLGNQTDVTRLEEIISTHLEK